MTQEVDSAVQDELAAAKPPVNPVVALLEGALERARAGDITNCALAYLTREGGSAVVSTPISPVMLGHLGRLFDQRVDEAYAAARQRQNEGLSPTGAVRSNPSPAATEPARKSARSKRTNGAADH
jgi:hypothetical protein